jgi:fumarate reductase flavoprotein subunit
MADAVITADFVVIGSGATGTVAALTAAEGGAKVVVIEKGLGFTSNFVQGVFATETLEADQRTEILRRKGPYRVPWESRRDQDQPRRGGA